MESLVFWLLIKQRRQSEHVSLASGKMWWAFSHFLGISKTKMTSLISRQISENNCYLQPCCWHKITFIEKKLAAFLQKDILTCHKKINDSCIPLSCFSLQVLVLCIIPHCQPTGTLVANVYVINTFSNCLLSIGAVYVSSTNILAQLITFWLITYISKKTGNSGAAINAKHVLCQIISS